MKKRLTRILFAVITLLSACEKDDDPPEPPHQPRFDIELNSDTYQYRVDDTIRITAQPDYWWEKAKMILFYYDNQLVGLDTSSPFEQNLVAKRTGRHEIRIRIYDESGYNWIKNGKTIHVVDHITPDVSAKLVPKADHYIVGDSLKFDVTASSGNGEIVSTSLFINEVLFASDSIAPYAFTLDSLPLGTFYYHVSATDVEGFTDWTFTRSVVVRENSAPWVSITQAHNGNPYIPGENIKLNVSRYDDDDDITKVEIYANDSLIADLGLALEYTWTNPPGGDYFVEARAYDSHGGIGISDKIEINVFKGMHIDHIISELLPTENNDLFFGLSQEAHALFLINAQEASFTEISLPGNQPVSMDYSQADQKLYIAYQQGNAISVWDNNTQSLSSIPFSSVADVMMIKADAQNRRLYVLAYNALSILNPDNGNLLLDAEPIGGNSMVVDPVNRWLFTGVYGQQYGSILKYDIAGDEPTLLQSTDFPGRHLSPIVMHPGYDYVLLPNEYYYTYAFDTQNLFNIVGAFELHRGLERITVSPNGQIMLGNSYDDLYIMNAQNFQVTGNKLIPNAAQYIRFCTDNQGNKLIAYTHDHYSNQPDEQIIYILDIP